MSDSHITCSAVAGVRAVPEPKLAGGEAKEKLVAALQSALGFCTLRSQVTDAKLADTVIYYGDPAPRVQALVGIADDWADHYAQQAIYLRLNGILPPTAKPAASASASSDSIAVARDGQHDFDFEIGTWGIEMKRLAHPLSGSSEWTHRRLLAHRAEGVGRAREPRAARERSSVAALRWTHAPTV